MLKSNFIVHQVPLSDILSTAQNLVSMLSDTLTSPGNVRPLRQGNSAEHGVGQHGDQSSSSGQSAQQERRSKSNCQKQSVQQEIARCEINCSCCVNKLFLFVGVCTG